MQDRIEASPSGTDHGIIREKQRAAAMSVIAGLTLTVLKLVAGLATSSLGLLAEAAHSALDLCAAVMTWFAVRASWRPPDDDHQYGHGKVENLSAFAETLLLVLTSFWILWEATRRILGDGPEVEPSIWGFLVMAISIVTDFFRSRDLKRVARKSGSQALEADALHFSTDIASSSVVIAGLLGVLLARRLRAPWLELADPIAASAVALIVLVLSWKLGKRSVDMLLDRAPKEVTGQVEQALLGLEGIERKARVRLRQAGDRMFVDVDLTLRRGLNLAEAERISQLARSRIRERLGANTSVTVQIEAKGGDNESLRQRVATAVAMEGVHGHNITIRHDPDGCHADFHLELAGSITLGEGHSVADRVEARVLREVPELRRVDIHLEMHDEDPESVGPLDPGARGEIESRILAAARGIAAEDSVHDLMLTRTAGGLYLSCHCFVAAEISLSAAHALTDRLERAFRQAVPELARVSVHAEPHGAEVHHRRS